LVSERDPVRTAKGYAVLYDISPPLSPALPVWPGDVPLTYETRARIEAGDAVALAAIRTTVHLGAHADAPAHYRAGAPTIDVCEPAAYLGPCELFRVAAPRSGLVTPDMLPHVPRAPRVLIATGTRPDPGVFNQDFAGLSVALLDALQAAGVRLVGVDTPSVDRFADADLPAHRRCGELGLLVLEGLTLASVPAGVYELIALPLKLVGLDGSPVRAVLRGPDQAVASG
jgi:arylformamidase